MAESRPTISTHVLDVGSGRPAAGLPVRLTRLVDGLDHPCGDGSTDGDGRIADLLVGGALEAGDYRITFDVDDGGFFRSVSIEFRVADPAHSVHVPLIRAPYSLSTYRGS
ncbi:MAG TPA: hydroxyisourate hydrolase [Candidatus Saccharimonadia bacterium]|nr:hydroxyisourate hydrolase [Candidatus Saccharimonadia bacterium]